MELWAEVRRRVLTGELSRRQAAKEYQLNYRTVEKIVGHVEPPGYRRENPRKRPRMEGFLPLIAQILEADKKAPNRQSTRRPSGPNVTPLFTRRRRGSRR